MNSEYRVVSAKTMFEFRHMVIEWNGWVLDVVYGHTDNGWFLAVPNHRFALIICEPTDTIYNLSKIFKECNNETMALVITQAIKEDCKEWKKENCW